MANLAIGGGWPGSPNASTVFPNVMEIDYIRAYKYVSSGGISLNGPGNGISYTAIPYTEPALWIGLATVEPETASQGQYVNISVIIQSNGEAFTGLNIQFPIVNATQSLSYPSTTLSIPAGGSGKAVLRWKIPDNQPNGYLQVGCGVFSSNWGTNYKWVDGLANIGVNKIVGGYIGTTVTSGNLKKF